MKNITNYYQAYFFLFLVGSIGVTACNQQPEGDLASYVAKRDSLMEVKGSIEAEIAQLDEILAELDTTASAKLVTTFQPTKGTFRHYFEVYGNVQTDRAASLNAETGGLVNQILVEEGQYVKKGDLLVKIDASLLQRNMTELETQLDLASTLFEKQKRLWDQNIGSEVQYLEAKNRKEGLENSINTLQEQLGKNNVRAPFDGIVDKIFPKIGEMTSAQMPLIRLINNKNMYVNADVSERYIGKVKEGDSVWVLVNRTDTIEASIDRVGAFINPNNRSFEVRVNLDGNAGLLMPNSLVILKINDFSAEDAIAIPSSLIMQDGSGSDYVFIAESNEKQQLTARRREVKAGMRYQGYTLLNEGIDTKAAIIDKGSRGVRDGDRIEEVNF
jgi:RND family efflux transporter MFP subunit